MKKKQEHLDGFWSKVDGIRGDTVTSPHPPSNLTIRRRSLVIPDDLWESLRAYAWSKRVPMTQVVIKAIREYLKDKDIPLIKPDDY